MASKSFSQIDKIPGGTASDLQTPGCIVLEGGAFRSVYEEGVLDCLMRSDINMSCVVGVSAGAMNGMHYLTGQIGRSARFNLKFRFDSRYIGAGAFKRSGNIVGFDFAMDDGDPIGQIEPFDMEKFMLSPRRFVAVATDCRTGKAEYFEKGKCGDIIQAVKASASMPCFGKMVWIDGVPYLDGGCRDSMSYLWAMKEQYRNIIVVRTRTKAYRRSPENEAVTLLQKTMYRSYPNLRYTLEHRAEIYNRQCEDLAVQEAKGRVFVVSPSRDLGVSRLEKNMERLGALYFLGYYDMQSRLEELRSYLSRE